MDWIFRDVPVPVLGLLVAAAFWLDNLYLRSARRAAEPGPARSAYEAGLAAGQAALLLAIAAGVAAALGARIEAAPGSAAPFVPGAEQPLTPREARPNDR